MGGYPVTGRKTLAFAFDGIILQRRFATQRNALKPVCRPMVLLLKTWTPSSRIGPSEPEFIKEKVVISASWNIVEKQ